MKNFKKLKQNFSSNFHDDGTPKEGSYCICLSVILTDPVLKKGKNYQPQVFLEECKYTVKEKKSD